MGDMRVDLFAAILTYSSTPIAYVCVCTQVQACKHVGSRMTETVDEPTTRATYMFAFLVAFIAAFFLLTLCFSIATHGVWFAGRT